MIKIFNKEYSLSFLFDIFGLFLSGLIFILNFRRFIIKGESMFNWTIVMGTLAFYVCFESLKKSNN